MSIKQVYVLDHVIKMNMDVSEFIHAAADAAKKQHDEYKEQMQDILNSMEQEIQFKQKRYDDNLQNAIQQAENDAIRKIDLMQKEMQQSMQKFEDETTKAAEFEIEYRCAEMQKSLEMQYQSQCEKMAADWESALQEKDIELRRQLETARHHHEEDLQHLQRQHDMEMASIKSEAAANQNVIVESRQIMNLVAAEADEQIQALKSEILTLQGQVREKENELKNSADDMADLDHAFMDIANEINTRHRGEVVQISDEKLMIAHENDRLRNAIDKTERENALLKEELEQLRMKYKIIESKACEREELAHFLDQRKSDEARHISEFQSCKQLLERQLFELKIENKSLSKEVDEKSAIISEVTEKCKEEALKAQGFEVRVVAQKKEIDDLQNECLSLNRRCTDVNESFQTFQREAHRCSRDMEHQMNQKERQLEQLTLALDEMSKRPCAKREPVVVHLHGNDENQKRSASVDNECHHLRTRLLDLQRSNYRLENDLIAARQQCQANGNVSDSSDLLELQQENNGLKQIVTMMRKEMEQMLQSDESAAIETHSSHYLAIKQQLVQCHAYLDILLRSRDVRSNLDHDDELVFLRSRCKELSEENLR